MARYGNEPGDRGTLDVRVAEEDVIQGFFIPKVNPAAGTSAADRLATGVKLIELCPSEERLTIYPTDTRHWSDGYLGPKYSKIRSITIAVDVEPDSNILDMLEELPSGFTKDYEYGLGIVKECKALVELIEEHTQCSVIEFAVSGDPQVTGCVFRMSFTKFNDLRTQLVRIKNRGDIGIRRVKETFVHNVLADTLGLKPRSLSLGRLPTSRWMTQVAAGEVPLSDKEQGELFAATTASAAQLASESPAKVARLQRDIELVNLEQLITSYTEALDAGHNENWWQRFFEKNIFALQLLFGGPTVFVDAQVPIGGGASSTKGKKIADYLFSSAMTNNAAIVEIKRPSTRLMKRKPYREGVYGVQGHIGEAITQVLDQALQLTRHEADTKPRTGLTSWVSNAPRCFVVAGLTSELDTDDKKKSFDLYREHLSGVRIVTYDEVLEQLVMLRDFLAFEGSSQSRV